jgi:hypothetical protein
LSRSQRAYLAWTCAVLLLGAFLLTYRLIDFPPGLHVDAAVEGFNVQDVLRGQLAIFFPINMGHGAAYVYWEAAIVALAGTHRLAYGFAGFGMTMLGTALTIRTFRLLFGPAAAVLAGALMAVSLWVMFIGRIGVWQSTMPVAAAAPVYFLWRLYRWGRRRDALLGGLALGLSQYAYYAIRFLPVLVLALFAADLARSRKRARLLAEYVGVSLLVFLPEGLYFVLNPEVLMTRPEQVTIFSRDLGQTLANVADGAGRTAGMFFVLGDYRPWQAIPYRPVFDPLLAALFCLGLCLALVRWREARYRWAILWLTVMLLPTALTSEAPSFFRALGAAPAAFVFPALAMVWLWQRLRQARALPILAALLVLAEAAVTYAVYFQQWGPSAQAAVAFDAQDTALARFAEQHPGQTIYFSDIRTLGGQPVRAMVTATQQQGWYPEDSAAIPLPPNGRGDVLYAGSPRSAIGALAPAWLPQVETLETTTPTNPRGMWAFRWPAAGREQLLAAQRPFEAVFGQDLRLRSYAIETRGGQTALNLIWQQLRPAGPYDLYTHVLDASGKQVAQDDKLYFPVEILGLKERPGEGTPTDDLVLTRYTYQLPRGPYQVEIGAVHRSDANPDVLLGAAGPSVTLPLDVP